MSTAKFDLVLKGGRVVDPSQDIDAKRDVAISGGKIAAIEADIAVVEGRRFLHEEFEQAIKLALRDSCAGGDSRN